MTPATAPQERGARCEEEGRGGDMMHMLNMLYLNHCCFAMVFTQGDKADRNGADEVQLSRGEP